MKDDKEETKADDEDADEVGFIFIRAGGAMAGVYAK